MATFFLSFYPHFKESILKSLLLNVEKCQLSGEHGCCFLLLFFEGGGGGQSLFRKEKHVVIKGIHKNQLVCYWDQNHLAVVVDYLVFLYYIHFIF